MIRDSARQCKIQHGDPTWQAPLDKLFSAFFCIYCMMTLDSSGNLAHLEQYIDEYFNKFCVMNRTNKKPSKINATPDNKRPCSKISTGTTPSPSLKPLCCTEVSNILLSIEQKLSRLNSGISLVEILHKEFQAIRQSLEFSQKQNTHQRK